MKRLVTLAGIVSLIVVACGVRAPPRPPRPDARPADGDPNMVPTQPTQEAPASNALPHEPSYPDGGIPWFNRDGGSEYNGPSR